MRITKDSIQILREKGITLNMIFFLEDVMTKEGLNIPLTAAEFAYLEKLRLIQYGEITDAGVELLTLFEDVPRVPTNKAAKFEEFFNTFPKDDSFLPLFPRTRDFRVRRDEVYREYLFALEASQITEEALINATREYVNRFANSLPDGHSPFKFMKGPLNFLKERVYLDYLTPVQKTELEDVF